MKTILFDNDSGRCYEYDGATNIKTFLRSNPKGFVYNPMQVVNVGDVIRFNIEKEN